MHRPLLRAPSPLGPHPREQGERAAEQLKWMGLCGRGQARGLRDAGQVMPPAGNWSRASGPHFSAVSATDRLSPGPCPFPLPLWMKP